MSAPRFEILTDTGGDWENVWGDTGPDNVRVPVTFPSRAAAQDELNEFLAEADAEGLDYARGDFCIRQVAELPVDPRAKIIAIGRYKNVGMRRYTNAAGGVLITWTGKSIDPRITPPFCGHLAIPVSRAEAAKALREARRAR